MIIAKESIHELKSPTFFLFNQILRMSRDKSQSFRDQIIESTIRDFEPRLYRQNQKIRNIAGNEYMPEFESINIVDYLQQYRSDGHFLIEGDQSLLKILFSNIYRNAKEACAERSQIVTTLQVESGHVVVTVSNPFNSPIVDAKLLFQGGFTSKNGGSGVGLRLCKHIAQIHSGKIAAHVENAQFAITVSLPIKQNGP